MGKLTKEPKVFNTQREAYWYREGREDLMQELLQKHQSSMRLHNLEFLDHLPVGGDDITEHNFTVTVDKDDRSN